MCPLTSPHPHPRANNPHPAAAFPGPSLTARADQPHNTNPRCQRTHNTRPRTRRRGQTPPEQPATGLRRETVTHCDAFGSTPEPPPFRSRPRRAPAPLADGGGGAEPTAATTPAEHPPNIKPTHISQPHPRTPVRHTTVSVAFSISVRSLSARCCAASGWGRLFGGGCWLVCGWGGAGGWWGWAVGVLVTGLWFVAPAARVVGCWLLVVVLWGVGERRGAPRVGRVLWAVCCVPWAWGERRGVHRCCRPWAECRVLVVERRADEPRQ